MCIPYPGSKCRRYLREYIHGNIRVDHDENEAGAALKTCRVQVRVGVRASQFTNKIHNMSAKNLIADAMEIEIRRTREALRTDVYIASVHYDNVKRLSGTLHLLTNFEARILADQPDID